MSDRPSLAYRPDVDGLRAVAVTGVLAYHAFPQALSGGFAGVDVFFVISGFLITSIIARQVAEQRFSLLDFYARRIKRLFPALILVLAATALAGWFYLLPHEYRLLGRHIASGAAYIINFTLKGESGYFDADAEAKPLLHLWSLAIEEQFYLLWPLLLMLAVPRRFALPLVAIILAASLSSNMARVASNTAAAFFLPHNRFWELAIGALLALATAPPRPAADSTTPPWSVLAILRAPPPRLSDALSLAGLGLVALAYFGLHARLAYPGAWALIPCTGAALLIAAGPGGLINRILLANPLAVAIGLISYPLYLWHWPLLSFQSILGIDSIQARLAALAAATVLAAATYVFAERPVRHASTNAVPLALLGAAMLFVPLGLLARNQIPPPRLSAPEFADVSAAAGDWSFLSKDTRIAAPGGADVRKAGTGKRRVLFFGDSNIQQYWPRVEQLLAEGADATVYFGTAQGCLPIPKIGVRSRHRCTGFAEAIETFAGETQIEIVVISAMWAGYFNKPRPGEISGSTPPVTFGSEGFELAMTEFSSMLGRMRAKGMQVWVVLTIPTGGRLAPQLTLVRSLTGETRLLASQVSRKSFETSWLPIRERIVNIAEAQGARIIDPAAAMCKSDACPGRLPGGTLIYKDASHLRAAFARDHATFIDPPLTDAAAAIPRRVPGPRPIPSP